MKHILPALIAVCAMAAEPVFAQTGPSLIQPVLDAIQQERDAQAALPPAATDSERLIRMGRMDQAVRQGMRRITFFSMEPGPRQEALSLIGVETAKIDRENQAALEAMTPPEGWFTRSRYGPEASTAAFLIAQHAGPDMWRRLVPVLERLSREGEVEGQHYAMMYDRLQVTDGKLQRFGTQAGCHGGRIQPAPVEEPETVDVRRAALGLPPLAEYAATLGAQSC